MYNNYTRNWGVYAVCASVESQVMIFLELYQDPFSFYVDYFANVDLFMFITYVDILAVQHIRSRAKEGGLQILQRKGTIIIYIPSILLVR